jgi:hypothetical protein
MVLRLASCLVPRSERVEWLSEWQAELFYVHERHASRATMFCLGAFQDALWIRRNRTDEPARALVQLASPAGCLSVLAVLAATAVLLAYCLPGVPGVPYPVRAFLLPISVAVLILPAVTHFSLGECPRNCRARRRWFLAVKIALMLPLVYFGTRDLSWLIAPQIQPHGWLIGYVIGFRWVLVDQRRRCPVCLRRLACPTRIGCASQVLLEWYGTELICTRGHGLMHVPELPESSYAAQTWLQLDGSWRGLFSRGSKTRPA